MERCSITMGHSLKQVWRVYDIEADRVMQAIGVVLPGHMLHGLLCK